MRWLQLDDLQGQRQVWDRQSCSGLRCVTVSCRLRTELALLDPRFMTGN